VQTSSVKDRTSGKVLILRPADMVEGDSPMATWPGVTSDILEAGGFPRTCRAERWQGLSHIQDYI
jgi:hypothetical protein